VLRIPLVMHVPKRLLAARHWDADGLAWSTDVTPSLYELLGDTPLTGDLLGRTLFSRAGEAPPARPELHLVQSSYSRIFGLVDRDGQWMFSADGNRNIDEFFDLNEAHPTRQTISDADRVRYQRWLLERIRKLNAYYLR
jgi:hypothetical protein